MARPFRSARISSAPVASDADAMAEYVMSLAPADDAEALKLLRASFSDQPLSVRLAALDILMRRRRGGTSRR